MRKQVSLVMLSMDRLDFTKQTLKSLAKTTPRHTYELIVIDNASHPPAFDWLLEESRVGNIDVLIRNKVNLGFIKASNQGIKIARGKYIALINNDLIFTDNWLEKLLKPLKDKKVGISTPLRFDGVTDQTVGRLIQKGFAMPKMKWTKDYLKTELAQDYSTSVEKDFERMVHFTKNYVAFFCVLIKRDLFSKIGLLDERFGMGFAEDNDFCKRTFNAGYKIAVCLDTFVYHYGMITWSAMYPNEKILDRVIKDKVKIFEEKWKSETKKEEIV